MLVYIQQCGVTLPGVVCMYCCSVIDVLAAYLIALRNSRVVCSTLSRALCSFLGCWLQVFDMLSSAELVACTCQPSQSLLVSC
jgi:hypothetical protein